MATKEKGEKPKKSARKPATQSAAPKDHTGVGLPVGQLDSTAASLIGMAIW